MKDYDPLDPSNWLQVIAVVTLVTFVGILVVSLGLSLAGL